VLHDVTDLSQTKTTGVDYLITDLTSMFTQHEFGGDSGIRRSDLAQWPYGTHHYRFEISILYVQSAHISLSFADVVSTLAQQQMSNLILVHVTKYHFGQNESFCQFPNFFGELSLS